MHVVLVVPGGVDRSGTERVIPALLWLIERLSARHRVTVVAIGQEPHAAKWPLVGAEIVNVAPIAPGLRGLADAVRRVVRAVGSNGRPDVVHGFWASVSGLAAVAAARRYRVPSVVSAAGGEIVSLPEIGYGGAQGRGGRWIASRALRGATAVTVSSGWMAEHVRTAGYRVDDIVALGVDTALLAPMPGHSAIPGRLVQVANRNRVKDPFTLLDAFAAVRRTEPTASLHMIGVDTLDGEVERYAATIGLVLGEELVIHDYVTPAELPAHYRAAQLHVVSSRHDAAPVVVLEASACGVPTVGTRVGHVTDLAALTPPAASVVPTGDAPTLAGEIVRLLRDEHERARLGATARAWSLEHNADFTARRFGGLYEQLVAGRSTSRRSWSASDASASMADSGEVPRSSR